MDALTGLDGTDDLRTYLAAQELSAPDLVDYEVVAALRGLTRRGQLRAARAEEALDDFDDLPIRRWPSGDGLRGRAFRSGTTSRPATPPGRSLGSVRYV